jgi:hypothetical protein
MGALSQNEIDMARVYPTWKNLDAVKAFEEQLVQFLHEELPAAEEPARIAAFTLCHEFRDEIWPHAALPDRWDLVLADRAGQLDRTIAELNAEFAVSFAASQ